MVEAAALQTAEHLLALEEARQQTRLAQVAGLPTPLAVADLLLPQLDHHHHQADLRRVA